MPLRGNCAARADEPLLAAAAADDPFSTALVPFRNPFSTALVPFSTALEPFASGPATATNVFEEHFDEFSEWWLNVMEDLHQRPGLFALGNEPHGREDVLALMDAAEQLAVFDRAQRLQLAGVEDGTAAQNKMVTRAREIFSRNPAESAKRLSDVHDRWLDIFGKAHQQAEDYVEW